MLRKLLLVIVRGHMKSIALICLLACAASAGCANTDPEESTDVALGAASTIEDPAQYESCKENGHGSSGSNLDLGHMRDNDPATQAAFSTAECIVGRMGQFRGTFRPYHLQSFKPRGPAQYSFIFKRESKNVTGEAPSECLKLKLTAHLGATDVFVTIERVKQLAPKPQGELCSDNGET